MPKSVTQKLIESHILVGKMELGEEIALKIDQTLTQDATGTMVMLELEAMGLDRTRTEVSVQYVDHNLLQTDFKNADAHLFLQSACKRFGIWFSRPGNGVSHPVHMERFGQPQLCRRIDGHARDRRRRVGSGDVHRWGTVLCQDAKDRRRKTDRQTARMGKCEGRNPGDVAPARCLRRCGKDLRILRRGAGTA